jgi:hypothetical protein
VAKRVVLTPFQAAKKTQIANSLMPKTLGDQIAGNFIVFKEKFSFLLFRY